jgi:hypothetical protein
MNELDWPSALLTFSPRLEQGLVVAAGCTLLALAVVASRADPSRHQPVQLARSTELAFLLLIVVGGLVARLLGYTSTDEPRWWFAQTTPLWLGRVLVEEGFIRGWLGLLWNTQARWTHTSAVLMPVAAVFQLVAGPSFHLAQLVGTFWGVMTILAAWAVGRLTVSPSFGVLFAGFVAFSPMQVVWSRLGSIPIGGGAHVLGAITVTYLAARRRNAPLALLAGITCWALMYNYHGARLGLPLALLALFAGIRMTDQGAGRSTTPVVLAFASGVVLPLAIVGGTQLRETLWPHYPGYVGNNSERSLTELVSSVGQAVGQQAGRTARVYFWAERASAPYVATSFSWGMDSGGLCYLPITVLAAIGCFRVARRWREQCLWIAFGILAFAVPCLSAPTARRLLLFDLAWCALAAHGLMALLCSRPLAALPARVRTATAATFLIALAAWTLATVAALNAATPRHPSAPIPFGESGFGDGSTCIECVRTAEYWREQITQNNLVVLFDTDMERENRTIPAGLPMYGNLAALVGRKPDHFMQYYAVAENFDMEPPTGVPYGGYAVYEHHKTDFASYLSRRLDEAHAVDIIWHFERPTQWERFLAERLAAAGGHTRTLPRDALSRPRERRLAEHPLEVRIPWSRRREALRAVIDSSAYLVSPERGCFALERTADTSFHSMPLLLAAGIGGTLPEWVMGSYQNVERPSIVLPGVQPAGLGFDWTGRLRILRQDGRSFTNAQGTDASIPDGLQISPPTGRNCAAFTADHWWVVDPLVGRLSTTAAPTWTMPQGPWSGVAPYGEHHLTLAAADQTVHIVDTRDGSTPLTFSAIVPPSRRFQFGECSPIAAGNGWIATYNHFFARLAIYDAKGNGRTVFQLDRELEVSPRDVIGIGGRGSYLGVSHGVNPAAGTHLTTFTVRRVDGCPGVD